MKQLRAMMLWIVAALMLAAPAHAQTFPALSGRVVDAANLLSPAQEAQLTQLSEDVEKASSRQFVVATIPDLQGYPVEEYGYKLGRAWKIGQSEANNGIVLIVAPKERKVRIEVGYGLEPLMTDALSSMIIQDLILPRFKADDIPGGILDGANEIAAQMKLPLEAAEARAKQRLDSQRAQAGNRARSGNDGVGVLIAIFGMVMFFAVVLPLIFARRGGRRYRGGSGIGNIILWTALDAAMRSGSRGSWGDGGSSWGGGGGSSWGGGGGGGFSGGGGSFGGGGASGSW